MKEYIVLYPDKLITSILEESKKIQKEIYLRAGDGIYFRVKTIEKLQDPHRLFIKGDGRVIEAQVKPHISLVHNIELPESETEKFFEKIEKIAKKYKSFNLEFDGVGNYNQSFTFFLKFKGNAFLSKMRDEILSVSKPFLTEEEYNQHASVEYVPHVTVLYDDIDPKKVKAAQKLLNTNKFKEPILVNNIQIWEVTGAYQKPIKTIHLGG